MLLRTGKKTLYITKPISEVEPTKEESTEVEPTIVEATEVEPTKEEPININENPKNKDENIKLVKNRLLSQMGAFILIVEEYDKMRNSEDIRSLPKEKRRIALLEEAKRVVKNGEQLILTMTCWLGEPDILNRLRFHFPKVTMECHIYLMKMMYILDRIREKYEKTNIMLSDKAKEVVKKCLELLNSFGPHILWLKPT